MTEHLGEMPSYEQKNPERGDAVNRLGIVVEVLGFEEDEVTAGARMALVERVIGDGEYDRDNQEHRDLLIAYQDAGVAALGDHPEPDAVIAFDLAQASTWLQIGDTERFRDKVDPDDGAGILESMFNAHLDAAVVEVLGIMDDLADQEE